jgi:hypothetical protein
MLQAGSSYILYFQPPPKERYKLTVACNCCNLSFTLPNSAASKLWRAVTSRTHNRERRIKEVQATWSVLRDFDKHTPLVASDRPGTKCNSTGACCYLTIPFQRLIIDRAQ